MPASRPSSPSGAENFRNSASSVWATGRCKTRAVHGTIPPVFSCIEDHDGVCDPPFTRLQAGATPHLRMLSRIGIRLPLLFFADVRHHLFHATICVVVTLKGTGMMWAVSQAAPLRRINIDNDLVLFEYQPPIPGAGEASGGFMVRLALKHKDCKTNHSKIRTRWGCDLVTSRL